MAIALAEAGADILLVQVQSYIRCHRQPTSLTFT
jgi:hypothetical protein